MTMDSRQRVWVRSHSPQSSEGRLAIFDPGRQIWEEYLDYREALAAQTNQPVGFAVKSKPRPPLSSPPAFDPPNRVAYLTHDRRLAYFDGRRWREFTLPEIQGTKVLGFNHRPFFNGHQRLAVASQGLPGARHTVREFTEENGWLSAGEEHSNLDLDRGPTRTVPPGSVTTTPDSLVRDAAGLHWLVWQHQLYRAGWGLCVPQFAPEEVNPFDGSGQLGEVLLDGHGNAFLYVMSPFGPRDYYILRDPVPPPDARLALRRTGADSAEADLDSSAPGTVRFRWRLNDGPWSEPATNRTVHLGPLFQGKYALEARSADERLRVTPHPARLEFTIQADIDNQIASFIAALKSRDYAEREKAVKTLAQRPALAAPALRRARTQADDDLRWWIDAALQELQPAHENAGISGRR
jgi:hypothetical protein